MVVVVIGNGGGGGRQWHVPHKMLFLQISLNMHTIFREISSWKGVQWC